MVVRVFYAATAAACLCLALLPAGPHPAFSQTGVAVANVLLFAMSLFSAIMAVASKEK